jgi:hypothetical protein
MMPLLYFHFDAAIIVHFIYCFARHDSYCQPFISMLQRITFSAAARLLRLLKPYYAMLLLSPPLRY